MKEATIWFEHDADHGHLAEPHFGWLLPETPKMYVPTSLLLLRVGIHPDRLEETRNSWEKHLQESASPEKEDIRRWFSKKKIAWWPLWISQDQSNFCRPVHVVVFDFATNSWGYLDELDRVPVVSWNGKEYCQWEKDRDITVELDGEPLCLAYYNIVDREESTGRHQGHWHVYHTADGNYMVAKVSQWVNVKDKAAIMNREELMSYFTKTYQGEAAKNILEEWESTKQREGESRGQRFRIPYLIFDVPLSSEAKLVYVYLCCFFEDYNRWPVNPCLADIAAKCNLSREEVACALNELERVEVRYPLDS